MNREIILQNVLIEATNDGYAWIRIKDVITHESKSLEDIILANLGDLNCLADIKIMIESKESTGLSVKDKRNLKTDLSDESVLRELNELFG